ncbi:MAG: DUF2480 family protein [Flavobacteriaceae bacterium]
MKGEIINRVANSALVTFDLEDFYPEGPRVALDISAWLHEGIVLREKEFRAHVKDLDLSPFKDAYVALYCRTEAIVPAWAYLLVSLQLTGISKKLVIGSLEDLETLLFTELIQTMDFSSYENKPVIIKGCSHKPIPENAYLLVAQKLKPIAKSIMYGEACSSVPLFKK